MSASSGVVVVGGVVGSGTVLATMASVEGGDWLGVALGVGASVHGSGSAREGDEDEYWRSEWDHGWCPCAFGLGNGQDDIK